MTLLVGYASPEFAILASDRMITWSKEVRVKGKVQVRNKYSESTIKATFFRGEFLVAYAGVADLGVNTELWLVDQLRLLVSRSEFAQWRERLAAEISDELKKLRRPARGSWIALMAVGFARNPATGQIVPLLETISNDREPLRLQAGRARQNFLDFYAAAPSVDVAGQEFKLWAVGIVPSMGEMCRAADAIKRYRRRYPERSREIARTLARVIVRRSDDLKGAGVGTAVQVTVMPRSAWG